MSFNRRKNNVSKLLVEVEKFLEFTSELADYEHLMKYYLSDVVRMRNIDFLNEIIVLSEFYGEANRLLCSTNTSDKKLLNFEINHIERFLGKLRFEEINSVEIVRKLYDNTRRDS